MTMSGALSPPMTSRAMVISRLKGVTGPVRSDCRGSCHFAPVIMAAGAADMVRPLQLAAIRAFGVGRGRQRMVRATHVATRLGGFLLGNGHRNELVSWGLESEPSVLYKNRLSPKDAGEPMAAS